MTEDDLVEAIGRAQRARELLENETLTEVLEELKQESVNVVMTTKDSLECDRERTAYTAFDRIKTKLQFRMANGRQAQRDLEAISVNRGRPQLGVV